MKYRFLIVSLAVVVLGLAVYLFKSGDNEKKEVAVQVKKQETPTITPPAKRTQPAFKIPESYDEAIALSKTGDPLAFHRVREYAKNAPQADFDAIKNNLAPLPRNASITKEMEEQRKRDMKMLTYFPSELALPVLANLTKESNNHKERCFAICAVGELRTEPALEVIKNFKITKNNGEQEYREATVAAIIAINRQGTKEAILYLIDTLDNVSKADIPKDDKINLQKMIVTSLQRMSGAKLTPNFNPETDNAQEISDKWRTWYNNIPAGYLTSRENEDRGLEQIVKKRLDSNK